MINKKDHYTAWALLLIDLDEVREHLGELTNQMSEAGKIDESEFAAHLGHIYAHLNRIWNSRNQAEEIGQDKWSDFSQFPRDLKPVG